MATLIFCTGETGVTAGQKLLVNIDHVVRIDPLGTGSRLIFVNDQFLEVKENPDQFFNAALSLS